MRKVILVLLFCFSLALLIIRYSFTPLASALNLGGRAGLRIEASQEAVVLIDQREVGKTPFQGEDFLPGDHLVSLEAGSLSWRGYVRLNEGTLSVVNRELAGSVASSSGEMISLEKGQGVTVISTPAGADVEIDSKNYGKTPLYTGSLSKGEHIFIISHLDFLKRSIRAVVSEGFNLNLSVDLAVAQTDFTKVNTTPIQASFQVVVKPTPTGFLRVRAGPSLNSKEVGRVSPGETLSLLEEVAGWYKIRLADGKEGYVSSSFVEKKNPL